MSCEMHCAATIIKTHWQMRLIILIKKNTDKTSECGGIMYVFEYV